MAVSVTIPALLKNLTGGEIEIEASGATAADVIDDLEGRYPGIAERFLDGDRNLRKHIILYLNDEDVRFLEGLKTAISDGDKVVFQPASAGGVEPGDSANQKKNSI